MNCPVMHFIPDKDLVIKRYNHNLVQKRNEVKDSKFQRVLQEKYNLFKDLNYLKKRVKNYKRDLIKDLNYQEYSEIIESIDTFNDNDFYKFTP